MLTMWKHITQLYLNWWLVELAPAFCPLSRPCVFSATPHYAFTFMSQHSTYSLVHNLTPPVTDSWSDDPFYMELKLCFHPKHLELLIPELESQNEKGSFKWLVLCNSVVVSRSMKIRKFSPPMCEKVFTWHLCMDCTNKPVTPYQ